MRVVPLVLTLLFLATIVSAQRQGDAPREIGTVVLVDDGKSVPMKYSLSGVHGHTGMTSIKEYFVFAGPKANVRATGASPTFEFNADPDFNVESGVFVFRFDTHKDRREIRVGKGKGRDVHYSIPKDHLIATTLEEIGDGPNSTKRYRMKVASPLKPGEYCLARSSDSCYDFGID